MSDEPQQTDKIDDYVMLAPLASGKSATVWEVMHEQSQQIFAMKLLNPTSMQEPNEKALLKHEAKVGAAMEHPNLIRNHGVVIRKTECYLLMDLFKAPNLKSYLTGGGREVISANIRKLVEGICLGLSHMHGKGWVHKDLKPENILLSRAGEVRIIDFSLAVRAAGGLSKFLGGGKGEIRGTRTYMAPETIRREPSTPMTDIYSIGVTLFECLTGSVPFKGSSPQDLLKKHIGAAPPVPSSRNEQLTPDIDRLILKMLAKKPKNRPESMDEVLREFQNGQVFKQVEVTEEEKRKEEEEQRQQEAAAATGDLSAAQIEELKELMSSRRDSRADARIQSMIRDNPAMQRQYDLIRQEQKDAEARKQTELKRRAESISKGKGGAAKEEKKPEKKKRRKKKAPPAQGAPAGWQPPPPGYGMPQQMPYGYGVPQAGMPAQQPGYPPMQPPPGAPMPQPGVPQQPPPPGGHPQPPPGQAPQMPPGGTPQTPPPDPDSDSGPQDPSGKAKKKKASARPKKKSAPPKPQEQQKKPDDDMGFMTELPDIE